MKNKVIGVFLLVLSLCLITGCSKPRQSALDFKEEYESINGKALTTNIKYRTLNIDDNNPYVKVSPKEIVEKLKNKESFYL